MYYKCAFFFMALINFIFVIATPRDFDKYTPAVLSYKSEIHMINSLGEIFKYASNPTKNNLIIFDIDKTLITYKDALPQNGMNKLMNELQKEFDLDEKDYSEIMSTIFIQADFKLLEKDNIYEIFQKLSDYQNVIALTYTKTGQFGLLDSMEKWKANLLSDFGIFFNNHKFQYLNHHRFDYLINKKNLDKDYPIFIDGILFTGEIDKGTLLLSFIDLMDVIPETIIMTDDRLYNLEIIAAALKKNYPQIQFIGLHYQVKLKDLNPEISKIQKENLIKNRKWISDKKINELMTIK